MVPAGQSYGSATFENELAAVERLRIAARRAAFQATQPEHRHEGVPGEPILAGLRRVRLQQRIDLRAGILGANRNVDVGLPESAIPLGNLVLEHDDSGGTYSRSSR